MGNKQKKMLSHEQMYKIMQWLPVVVASAFFMINALKGNTPAMIVIGICLLAFIGIPVISKKKNFSMYKRELLLAIAMPVLVFLISLFSGASYSDDFSIYLAIIALTGMFLEPKFTLIQIIMSDILLVLMYFIHPEKAGATSQYILCVACFVLASTLFYQVIKRGRAFIEISEIRAKESETLLDSLRQMGVELQTDFEASSAKIQNGTHGLQKGSEAIAFDAGEVTDKCNVVQSKIRESSEQLTQLNQEVHQFEKRLVQSKKNVTGMNQQIDSVSALITESGVIFREMQQMMNDISNIAKQINDISFKLTILSLNASVEAAHAGKHGSGFEVIATEMRELSETSGGFATQVSDVVNLLHERVELTSEKFSGSEHALIESGQKMSELVDSFHKLNEQFVSLYSNIEGQNYIVSELDIIFDELSAKAEEMHSNSIANQSSVNSIADALEDYRENIDKVVKNTQSI